MSIKPELSNSSIFNGIFEVPCTCVTCGSKLKVKLTGDIYNIDGVLQDFRRPREFACPNCNSHYISWGEIVITQ